tara:strand:- start:28 stop:471 length:444 start_codon:yes stop_codon:yes gene_type:complete
MVAEDGSTKCKMCGGALSDLEVMALAQEEREQEVLEEEAVKAELMQRAKTMRVFTVSNPNSLLVTEEIGLVFGNSSKQAFWGLSTQANRLSRAYEVALVNLKYDAAELGADAVIGVTFALNNSTGSSAKIAGSSDSVMLLGTAVKTK